MNSRRLILDGHKLQYHPQIVADFLEGREVHPVYAEISPVAYCNHHCIFCNYNYLGHKGKFAAGRMISLVEELAAAGVKSVVFAGSGEPTIHPDTIPAIERAKKAGLDVAMSTNGALLNAEAIAVIVRDLTWIRFSFSGGSPENYAKVHGTNEADYELVLNNIRKMALLKKQTGSKLMLGTQFLLLPENREYVVSQARVMKECGADYFVVKHFYTSENNEFQIDDSFRTPEFMEGVKKAAADLSDEDFQFIVRDESCLDREREYAACYGLPLIVYFREDGEVYTCFANQHDRNTSLGSILNQPFGDLWNSGSKRKAIDYINRSIDKNRCQANCRHHQINSYLWNLKHNTPEHINFI
jgi:MoaA/NifB/PqqE/SkfB family radical SAM enzyme